MSNKMNGNNIKFENLLPEDIQFMEQINNNVTTGNALPFDVPMDQMLNIIIRSLKWFWHWYGDATQESTLYVPLTELATKGVHSPGQIDVKLPNGIEGIFDLKQVGGITSNGISKALRFPILNSFRQSYSTYTSAYTAGGGMSSSGFRSNYGGGTHSMNDVVLQLYEHSQFSTMFKRGYRFSYNKNTQILRLMTGNIENGFVCQAFERLAPQQIYGDIMFEEYVTAKVEAALGKIVMAFNFELPGGVTINYDAIKAQGLSKVEKIEADIKDSNNGDFIITA